jgi:hypothetical protein
MKEPFSIAQNPEPLNLTDVELNGIRNHPRNLIRANTELLGQFPSLRAYMANLAWFIEPHNSTTDRVHHAPIGGAFFRGEVLGMELTKSASDRPTLRRRAVFLPQIDIETIIKNDDPHKFYLTGSKLRSWGSSGYINHPEIHQLIGDIEDIVEPKVVCQSVMRDGIGLCLAAVDRIRISNQMLRIADAIESDGIDWEAELANLNDSGGGGIDIET